MTRRSQSTQRGWLGRERHAELPDRPEHRRQPDRGCGWNGPPRPCSWRWTRGVRRQVLATVAALVAALQALVSDADGAQFVLQCLELDPAEVRRLLGPIDVS